MEEVVISSDEEDILIGENVGQRQAELKRITKELAVTDAKIANLLDHQKQLRSRREVLVRMIASDIRAPQVNNSGTFPWDSLVLQQLSTFGLSCFRLQQHEIINCTLQGRDLMCLLPSGGGKSLCYQLPALIKDGITLVVSPLLALIQDQVDALTALGIPAIAFTSLATKEQSADAYRQLDSPALKLVYVTPERILKSKRFMSKLEKIHQAKRLSRIAIDEAHTVSSYGNDFRPDCKKLGVLKQFFPDVPLIALTATATHEVAEDIKKILRIEGCSMFRTSVNRPNLMYQVLPKPSSATEQVTAIVGFIKKHYADNDSGIIYMLTRKECEQLAGELVSAGIGAAYYHADMQASDRESCHRSWSGQETQVMVATVAFGMGINHTAVRFVIHHSPSKSIENYYQESGRAGRDGLPARCVLFYRFPDVLRQASIVCYEPTWEANLMAMTNYAAASGSCRRAAIQLHFGEAPAMCRGMCDHCCASWTTTASVDINLSAAALLGYLQNSESVQKKVTLIQLIEAWRSAGKVGAQASAAAKAMTREDNEAVVAHMLMGGLLQLDFAHTAYATNVYLRCSDTGVHRLGAYSRGLSHASGIASGNVYVASGSAQAPELCAPVQLTPAPAGKEDPDSSPVHVGESHVTAELLERWRSEMATSNNVFSQCVLSDQHLHALADSKDPLPTTLEGLAACLAGMSRNGWEQPLLQLLQSHVTDTGRKHNGARNLQAAGSQGHGAACSVAATAVTSVWKACDKTSHPQSIPNQTGGRSLIPDLPQVSSHANEPAVKEGHGNLQMDIARKKDAAVKSKRQEHPLLLDKSENLEHTSKSQRKE